MITEAEAAFLRAHTWAVLATGRRDGSPQQSMVDYLLDDDGRLVVSVKAYTAKWRNALRQPKVCLTVPDGRAHLVVYGTATCIDTDPERAERTADVFAALGGGERPDPRAIVPLLDEPVTIAIDGMQFLEPVKVGDEVSVFCTIEHVGRTSMKIDVEAWRRPRHSEDRIKVTEAKFTFVAVDDDGRPRAVDLGPVDE